jgi:PAS domain S-box-containing protein
MSWVELVFAAVGGACVALAVVHVFIWLHQRSQYANLLFSLAAVSVAAVAVVEILLLHATTPAEYSSLLRLAQTAIAVFFPCMVGFVWFDLRTGWKWLAVLAIVLRLAGLAANYIGAESLLFVTVTELEPHQGWGIHSFPLPIGVANPMLILGQASTMAGLAFLATVLSSVLRGSDAVRKRRALAICASVFLCVVPGLSMNQLLVDGQLSVPLSTNLTIIPVVLVMGYLLGRDVLRASLLSRELTLSEARLRDSEERMRVAMTAADVGVWTWSLEKDTFWFSSIGGRIAGVSGNAEIPRSAVTTTVHPDDRGAAWSGLDAAVGSGDSYGCEYRCLLPDGRVRWVAARGRAEREQAGGALLVRGVLVDITQRRESEERLRRIVQGAPVGMMLCGPDGRILLANPQAHQTFGYRPSELHGLEMDALLGSAVPAGVFPADAQADDAHRELAEAHEFAGRRKDGSPVAVEAAFSLVGINETPHVLVSVSDISARKRMELENAQQRDELAHLSRVSLLGELSGSLAHELNQPLTAVLSNAQAALRFLGHQPPNLDEVRESLVHIVESDKRASEVIRRLRAMLRRERLDHQPLAMNEVVHEVLRLVHSDLLSRNVAVALDLQPDLPVMMGDRVQLQQVLLNLVLNACDAMRESDAPRVVSIRSGLMAGPAIEVAISDVGHGIAPDKLEHVFTPFVTSKAEGIGLGLAICRTIIEAHRGKLWASNNAGPGATLQFTLPVSNAD